MRRRVTNDTVKAVVTDLLQRGQVVQIASLDVGQVTDMSELFFNRTLPVGLDLNEWDVSNVTNMEGLFGNCVNIPRIGAWITDRVTNMSGMFAGDENEARVEINQDLSGWSTGNVTSMRFMFANCEFVHETGIGNWDTTNVTDMGAMFADSNFNQAIGRWNTSNVTDMNNMFLNCITFDQDIGRWNTSNVTRMNYMFRRCAHFNQDIGNWNTQHVVYMSDMFMGCTSFNQNIGRWNTSNVFEMSGMFHMCTSFHQDLIEWDTYRVAHSPDGSDYAMFQECPIPEEFKPLTQRDHRRLTQFEEHAQRTPSQKRALFLALPHRVQRFIRIKNKKRIRANVVKTLRNAKTISGKHMPDKQLIEDIIGWSAGSRKKRKRRTKRK